VLRAETARAPVGVSINYQLPQTKPAGKWIERFEEWLADSGFLK